MQPYNSQANRRLLRTGLRHHTKSFLLPVVANGACRLDHCLLRRTEVVYPKGRIARTGSQTLTRFEIVRDDRALRSTVLLVGLLNVGYFGVEFAVAVAIGSVSLFADSIDFLEDASVNFLIAFALGWSASRRSRLGMLLAVILLAPALAGLWTAWHKLISPTPPAPLPLTLTGAGALLVNLSCAFMLAKFRHHAGSLTKAAFLSARNDTVANIAIIAAGGITAYLWRSAWPDLIVGLGIAMMNADAARAVWNAAHDEHKAAGN
jgi:Co/Zn/Cd efflux system component